MKISKLAAIGFIFVFCSLLWFTPSKAEAFHFPTKICWEINWDSPNPAIGIFECAVKKMGKDYYIVQGRNNVEDNKITVFGGAQVDGTQIIMTLFWTFQNNCPAFTPCTKTMIAIIDPTTFNGTFRLEVGLSLWVTGTFTRVSCQ